MQARTPTLSDFFGTFVPSPIRTDCLGSWVLLLSPFFGSHHFPELWELGTDRTLVSAYASHLVTAKCPLKVTVVFSLGQWMVPFNGTNLHSTYSSVQGPELIPTLCAPRPSHRPHPPPGSCSPLTFREIHFPGLFKMAPSRQPWRLYANELLTLVHRSLEADLTSPTWSPLLLWCYSHLG